MPAPAPFAADPKRQAHDLVDAIRYQIFLSLQTWLKLQPGEALFLEGAEDFDKVGEGRGQATQVKREGGSVSLGQQKIRDVISNYWTLREAENDREVKFVYHTTASVCEELSSSWKPEKGLEIWMASARSKKIDTRLVKFLKSATGFSDSLAAFLKNASEEQILQELVKPMAWHCAQPNPADLEEILTEEVHSLMGPRGLVLGQSREFMQSLVFEVWANASDKNAKPLTKMLLDERIEQGSVGTLPINVLNNFARMLEEAKISGSSHPAPEIIETKNELRIPSLPSGLYQRDSLTSVAHAKLLESKTLLLTGSSGMGKTTLAIMIAGKLEMPILWQRFDSENVTGQIKRKLEEVRNQTNRKPDSCLVVLDNLPIKEPGHQRWSEDLRSCTTLLSSTGGLLLMTTQAEVSENEASLLLSECKPAVLKIPKFDKFEVRYLAELLGCPEELSEEWATIARLQASGHPQLVNAHLHKLKESQWPPPHQESVGATAAAISDQRQLQSRLISLLPEKEKTLAYRLSMVGSVFRREHSLRIANLPESISLPGEVFDHLLGPWIESYGDGLFQLSELLSGSGESIYPEDEKRRLNLGIAETFVGVTPCSPYELAVAFKHFVHAGELSRGADVVSWIHLSNDSRAMEEFTLSVIWYANFPLDTDDLDSLGHEKAVVFLILKLEVLSLLKREEETSEQALILAEWVFSAPQERSHLARMLAATKLLGTKNVDFSSDTVRGIIGAFVEIEVENPEFCTGLEIGHCGPEVADRYDFSRPVEFVVLLLATQVKGNLKTVAFLELMTQGKPEVIACLRQVFATAPDVLQSVVHGVWLPLESQPSEATNVIATLGQVLEIAEAGELEDLSAFASGAIALVQDRFLDDPGNAMRTLDSVKPDLFSHWSIVALRAEILFNRKMYGESLAVWMDFPEEKLTPELTRVLGLNLSLATRIAAISAAHCDKATQAAGLFKKALEFLTTDIYDAYQTGLVVDSAWMYWKSGDWSMAVQLIADATERVACLIDRPTPRGFQVSKILGATVLHCTSEIDGHGTTRLTTPPIPGVASMIEISDLILALPTNPVPELKLLVARLESLSGLGYDLTDRWSSDFEKITMTPFFFQRAQHMVERAFLEQNLNNLGDLLEDFGNEVYRGYQAQHPGSPDHMKLPKVVLEPVHGMAPFILALWGRGDAHGSHQVAQVKDWLADLSSRPWAKSNCQWMRAYVSYVEEGAALSLAGVESFAALLAPDVKATRLLQAQFSCLKQFHSSPWFLVSAGAICAQIFESWRRQLKKRFQFYAPNVNLPPLEALLEISDPELKDLAECLRVAGKSLNMTIPTEVEVFFSELESQVPAVYQKKYRNHGKSVT